MLYEAGSSNLVLWDNLEGSHRVGHDWSDLAAAAEGLEVGGRFRREGTYVCLCWFILMYGRNQYNYCKVILLQLKINFKSGEVRDFSDLGHGKEIWAPKNRCFWTVVLEKTLESPLDCKEIQPVNPKGNQSWIFIGRTAVEAETPILWPLVVKNRLILKDPDAGKDWRPEEKGTTEDERVEWHHRLNGHEFE